MKLGVSSYSFSKYLASTQCGYVEICDIAKEIGFEGIEFINLKNNDSFHTLYERLFQDDPCTLPGTIIIGGEQGGILI